jgi:nucleotide-binding universal stress UspA family protein
MKIILGVDGSPCSAAAAEFVKRMSWPAGSTVEVIRAVPPVLVAIPEAYLMQADRLDVLRMNLLVESHKYVEDVSCDLLGIGLTIDAKVIEDDPRGALVEAARASGADLLVVGSHGRSGLSKLFMGSVSSHVVTHAPCSVLVVRHP